MLNSSVFRLLQKEDDDDDEKGKPQTAIATCVHTVKAQTNRMRTQWVVVTNEAGASSLAISGSVGPMTRFHVITASALDNISIRHGPLQCSHKRIILYLR